MEVDVLGVLFCIELIFVIIKANIIREVQMKTTVRYHLTLVRMAIIKKSTNRKCSRGCIENTGGGNVGWSSHCEIQCGSSSEN